MNRYQKNRYEMFLRVQSCFNDYQQVWENNVFIAQQKVVFDGKIETINNLSIQIPQFSPKSPHKRNKRRKLLDTMLNLRGALLAHASMTDNGDMKTRYELAVDTLKMNSPQTDFRDFVLNMLAELRSMETELADYGVTPEMIEDAEKQAALFKLLVTSPSDAQNQVNVLKGNIQLQVKEVQQLLKDRIDPVMKMFSQSAPAFYNRYLRSRSVYDVRARYSSSQVTPNTEEEPTTD